MSWSQPRVLCIAFILQNYKFMVQYSFSLPHNFIMALRALLEPKMTSEQPIHAHHWDCILRQHLSPPWNLLWHHPQLYFLTLFPRKWFGKLSTLVPASWTNNQRPSSSPLSHQYSNSIKIPLTWKLWGKSHLWNLYCIRVTRLASLLVTIINFWQYACLSNQMQDL